MTVTINGTTGIDKVQDGSIQAADLASGVPLRSQLPAGTVLQVVQGSYTTVSTTTSGSFVASGLTASITPSSSSSKILVIVSCEIGTATTPGSMYLTLYRNGTTDLSPNASGSGFVRWYSAGTSQGGSASITYLDSPSSTASTSYTVYFNADSGATAYIGRIGANASTVQPNYITLMEIAA